MGRPAQPQFGLRPGDDHVRAPLHPALAHPLGPLPRNVGQRGAAPQVQRLAEHLGPRRVAEIGIAGPVDEAAEPQDVDPFGVDVEHVAPGSQQQPRLATGVVEHLADAADVHVQRVAGAIGLGRPPDPIDHGLHRHRTAGIDGQRRQHSALARRAGFDPATPGPDLDRSENPKLH